MVKMRDFKLVLFDGELTYANGQPAPHGLIPRALQTYNMSEADIAERDRLARENTRQVRRQKERLAKKGR